MIKSIYKLVITAKYSDSDSYIISIDEYYLPSVKSCLEAVETYTDTGTEVTIENVDITRVEVTK